MKKLALTTLTLAVASALISFCWLTSRKAAAKEAEARAAEQRLAETEAEAARQDRHNQAEQARLSAANAQLAEKAAKAAQLERSLATNTPSPSASPAPQPENQMAALLKDPSMKETMRKQGREAVARSVKQLVTTNLVRELGLTEEQTAHLKKLLTERGQLGFDFMMPIMAGDLDQAGLAEYGRKTKAEMAAITDNLKAFLGESGYKTFDDYEKAQPDRERLEKFAHVQDEAGTPLTAEQQSQLLSAMTEERARFKFTVDYSDSSQIDFEHFHDFYSEDNTETYFRQMQELNQQIVERARAILPPEQATKFEEALSLQLQKGRFVVKSTNAMLGKRAAK